MSGAPKLPTSFRRALADTRRSLRSSLHRLGRLNRAWDAPVPEQNLVLHFGAALLRSDHAVYGEADLPGRGRIDLLACSRRAGLLVEAASFGGVKMSKIMEDARRLEKYLPQAPWPLVSGKDGGAFWSELDQRWALILVSCSSTRHFFDCWSGLLDTRRLGARLASEACDFVPGFPGHAREEMRRFGAFLSKRQGLGGCLPVIKQDRKEKLFAGEILPISILWAAWRLP